MRRFFLVGIVTFLLAGIAISHAAQDASAPRKGTVASAPAQPVNLNTATAAQIETLPGVGPATAKRIIEYREKHGGYKKIEELMNVKGIGEKSFLKLKPLVTVGEPRAAAKQ